MQTTTVKLLRDRSAVWSRARRHDLRDLAFDVEHVAGPCRCRPSDLSAEANDAASYREPPIHLKTHRDRCGMPSARREPTEQGGLRGLAIRVKRLRVEFVRERQDLSLVERVRTAPEAPSDVQGVQIEKLARGFRHRVVSHACAPCYWPRAAASPRTASTTASACSRSTSRASALRDGTCRRTPQHR